MQGFLRACILLNKLPVLVQVNHISHKFSSFCTMCFTNCYSTFPFTEKKEVFLGLFEQFFAYLSHSKRSPSQSIPLYGETPHDFHPTAVISRNPARSVHKYFLFFCKPHLLLLFLHLKIRRSCGPAIPSVRMHPQDTLV